MTELWGPIKQHFIVSNNSFCWEKLAKRDIQGHESCFCGYKLSFYSFTYGKSLLCLQWDSVLAVSSCTVVKSKQGQRRETSRLKARGRQNNQWSCCWSLEPTQWMTGGPVDDRYITVAPPVQMNYSSLGHMASNTNTPLCTHFLDKDIFLLCSHSDISLRAWQEKVLVQSNGLELSTCLW